MILERGYTTNNAACVVIAFSFQSMKVRLNSWNGSQQPVMILDDLFGLWDELARILCDYTNLINTDGPTRKLDNDKWVNTAL